MCYLEVVRELLAHDTNKFNETPLSCASYYKHLEVVRELLAHGADPNIVNKNNETPSSWTFRRGNLEIVKLMEEYFPSLH